MRASESVYRPSSASSVDRAVDLPRRKRLLELVGGRGLDECAHHLAAVEAELDPDSPVLRHRPPTLTRTPCTASGWTNATSSPKSPRSGLLVDELDTLLGQAIQLAVEGRSPRRRHGACRDRAWRGTCRQACRRRAREQLDATLANANGHRFDTLGLDIVSRCSSSAPKTDRYVSTASSRSSTATPRWWIPFACNAKVMLPALGSASSAASPLIGTTRPTDSLMLDSACDVGEHRLHLVANERFLLEERVREPVERGAVLRDQPDRLLVGVVGQAGLLLVAQPLRLLGERVVVGAHRP